MTATTNPSDFMPSRLDDLPELGVGLGLRAPFANDLPRHQEQIDWLEIVADHYFFPTGDQNRQLASLAALFPLVPHGLAMSLGSADGLDRDYLEAFASVVDRLQPAWWSEHIAFTRAGGIDIGHLTPLPRTRAALDTLKANIDTVKKRIQPPLILENITETLTYPNQQMDEASFLGAIVDENDCGLLLDVTNLYTNSVNYRFDPLQVLWRLPPERIVQLHFAGGHWDQDYLIDSHSRPTPTEVWQLLEEVVRYAPVKGIVLERDSNYPPLGELIDEVQRASSIFRRHRRGDGSGNPVETRK